MTVALAKRGAVSALTGKSIDPQEQGTDTARRGRKICGTEIERWTAEEKGSRLKKKEENKSNG